MTSHSLTRQLPALALLLAATSVAPGCGLPPNPSRPRLWTMADLEALAAPMDPAATFAQEGGVPGGLPVADYVTRDDTGYHLTVRRTWTEGYGSEYVTAEVWKGFDEVWVQPAYVPITGFEDGVPQRAVDPDKGAWSPIFSVGPDSAFYSPFWRLFYFQVPSGASADDFKSAKAVIDSGVPLIEGPGRTMSLVPDDAGLPAPTAAQAPATGGPTKLNSGYLDGKNVSFLDFGADNFSWNDDLVVDETPLFVLLYPAPDGSLQPMHVPTVAGTGPLYSNRPPNLAPDGVTPHYGAYWRLYTVVVPPTARIFAPAQLFPDEAAQYPQSLVATQYGVTVLAAGKEDLRQWLGRVALNALPAADGSTKGCFDTYDDLDTNAGGNAPEFCQWLDSQPAIERAVPASAIEKTDLLVTCPFVSYRGVPVQP